MRTSKLALALLVIVVARAYYVSRHLPVARVAAPTTRYHGYQLNHAAIQNAKRFTVLISGEGFGGVSRGTGIVLDPGHILTCAHVAAHQDEALWIYFYPGYIVGRGKMIYSDPSKDLAIVAVDLPVYFEYPAPVFQPAHYDGEPITIIGNILGSMKWFVSYGIVSGENERDLYTDGLIRGGNSGGPWINEKGEVVALTDWGLQGKNGQMEGISGGISAATINKFLYEYKHPFTLDQLFTITRPAPTAKKRK